MPNWQEREETMFHTYAFFALGFLSGIAFIYSWASKITNLKNKELRQWRRDAIRLEEELMTLKETSR
jgi:hypothetical protein